nr:hypothetical protein [Legionella jordanis]
MTHSMIQEEVNIFQFPKDIHPADPDFEITIGDLHGNAMKLMFMLVKQGITSNLNDKDYAQLVTIYEKSAERLTKTDLNEFNRIINGIKFNKAAIRLIGDELADRGSNDYFTLRILQKLREQQVSVEILMSNHSVEFLQACEMHQENKAFKAPLLKHDHARSLENMQTLIERKLITPKEVFEITDSAYKPSLKAISYTLSEDDSEIVIFSHAPIGLNTIADLAQQFGVNYEDSTAVELAKTIDNINRKFQDYARRNTIGKLCPAEAMYKGYSDTFFSSDLKTYPFVGVMWNRGYVAIERPAEHNGYKLVYAHGHDSHDPLQNEAYVHNLDFLNTLGRPELWHREGGTYRVLQTNRKQLLAEELTARSAAIENTSSSPTEEQESLLQIQAATLGELKESFESQMDAIATKAAILRQDGHDDAANAAALLHQKVMQSYGETLGKRGNVKLFKQECQDAIAESRSALESHRGFKLILRYLAATITGFGVLFVAADLGYKFATGKHFSFFQTKTAQMLSTLEQTLEQATKEHPSEQTTHP